LPRRLLQSHGIAAERRRCSLPGVGCRATDEGKALRALRRSGWLGAERAVNLLPATMSAAAAPAPTPRPPATQAVAQQTGPAPSGSTVEAVDSDDEVISIKPAHSGALKKAASTRRPDRAAAGGDGGEGEADGYEAWLRQLQQGASRTVGDARPGAEDNYDLRTIYEVVSITDRSPSPLCPLLSLHG
jgi:hypothetical protein